MDLKVAKEDIVKLKDEAKAYNNHRLQVHDPTFKGSFGNIFAGYAFCTKVLFL